MIIFWRFGFHMDLFAPLAVLTLSHRPGGVQLKSEANLLFDRHTFDVLSELSDSRLAARLKLYTQRF